MSQESTPASGLHAATHSRTMSRLTGRRHRRRMRFSAGLWGLKMYPHRRRNVARSRRRGSNYCAAEWYLATHINISQCSPCRQASSCSSSGPASSSCSMLSRKFSALATTSAAASLNARASSFCSGAGGDPALPAGRVTASARGGDRGEGRGVTLEPPRVGLPRRP